MKIALLSNFWYHRGGLERVMLGDAAGLEGRGHTVMPFASAHALNEPSRFSVFFPPNVDHAQLGRDEGRLDQAATALRLFHNRGAVRSFERFVESSKPEIVHQHGTSRQLSPSVLERAHGLGIPTVLSLHDYSLRCPSGVLSRHGAPECIALSCAGHRYDRAVRFKCVHDSRSASAVAALELLVARALRRYEHAVDVFLVPTEYVAVRMREQGLGRQDIRVMPNAIEQVSELPAPSGTTFLAIGRLAWYKGFESFVDAARMLPDLRFVIAGDGPERAALEARASGIANLRFVGMVGENDLRPLIREARAVVVPSRSPETFGMVVLESWREGVPVIVTRRGALPDIVEHLRTGLVVEPDDVSALTDAIQSLADDRDHAVTLGIAGHHETQTTYAMAAHLDKLEALYRELVA